jgi:hypothetical protein
MANGLNDLTWDSSTSASIVLGTLRVPFQKLSPGKITVKRDKPKRVGESLASKRTPGSAEVGDFNGELLATDFESLILPRMPSHGGTLVEFPILITLKHPSVSGSLGILLDDSCIIEIDGPELDASEKALVYKLQFSAMQRFDKGRDGKWKALAYNARRPSSQARALMAF